MEEGQEQIDGFEAQDLAVRLPTESAVHVLGELGGGEGLGNGGKQDAPTAAEIRIL